ncbi:ribonuclease P protein component [Ruania alkalisoli]|uniref:Ribonuclease P protein component n=1 Tax=Ruania alkalisoli TaxID=2779775 RepID=A0A7M1ST60_9MICO|nr:ribonuclease P protein component [Ruania alkalisoli]
MLPARHRMRAASEFGATIRAGSRSSSRRVVVHYTSGSTRADAARVGFVVSKAVGGAVERNYVKRRLRAAMSEMVRELPDGSCVVVRALPAAQGAAFVSLRDDLSDALARAKRREAGR